jgi:hypothetical protein
LCTLQKYNEHKTFKKVLIKRNNYGLPQQTEELFFGDVCISGLAKSGVMELKEYMQVGF